MTFIDDWRRRKSTAFDLAANSAAARDSVHALGKADANLRQREPLDLQRPATATRCPFCVEDCDPHHAASNLPFKEKSRTTTPVISRIWKRR